MMLRLSRKTSLVLERKKVDADHMRLTRENQTLQQAKPTAERQAEIR